MHNYENKVVYARRNQMVNGRVYRINNILNGMTKREIREWIIENSLSLELDLDKTVFNNKTKYFVTYIGNVADVYDLFDQLCEKNDHLKVTERDPDFRYHDPGRDGLMLSWEVDGYYVKIFIPDGKFAGGLIDIHFSEQYI